MTIDWGTVAFAVLIVVSVLTVVAWVLRPLFAGPAALDTPDPKAVALLTRREAALASLRDLDADHADGRLQDRAYEELRAEVVADGAASLEALDVLATEAAGRTAELAARVESDVAERARKGPGSDSLSQSVGGGAE